MLLLSLLAGCAAEHDLWPVTRELCGLEEDERLGWPLLLPSEDGGRYGLQVPPDCAEALLFDLGGDPDALMASFPEHADLDALLEADRLQEIPPTGLAEIVRGAYWLLGSDLGPTDALRSPARWASEYAELARELRLPEHAPLSRVLYDHVTSRYSHLALLPEHAPAVAIAGTAWWSGSLYIAGEITSEWSYDRGHPISAMGVLVHEAAHARFGGLSHSLECEVGGQIGRFCDPDLDGAYGAELAALWAQSAAATPAGCLDDSAASEAAAFAETLVRVHKSPYIARTLPGPALRPCE